LKWVLIKENPMRYFPMLVIVLLVGLAPIIVLAAPCAPPTLERPCAYTPNAGSNDVSVIDTATDTVVATIPVGVHPNGVSIHPNGTRLYVTNSGDRTVSVIDTTTNMVINPPIILGENSAGSVVHPNGQRVYLDGGIGIFIIDTATNTVTDIIPIDGVHGVQITPPSTINAVHLVGLLGGASLSARGGRGGGTVPRCRYIPTHPRRTMRRCDTCPSGI
jgi:YVTN family beta-propeller protein